MLFARARVDRVVLEVGLGGRLDSTNAVVRNIATGVYNFFSWDTAPYWFMYFFLVVAFTYFYTDVIFRQQNLATVHAKDSLRLVSLSRPARTATNAIQMATLVRSPFIEIR